MALLRIAESGAGSIRKVDLTWKDGISRRRVSTSVALGINGRDAEKIRWYLEDFAKFPAEPAPLVAADAEARLAEIGSELFRQVFDSPAASAIWTRCRDRLNQVRLEVATDPLGAPGLPWELLRDPAGTALALNVDAFVRTSQATISHAALPSRAGDRLRVLLVISRPALDADVPFRSVAGQLVRSGARQPAGLDLDVLRPATFARLDEILREAAACGRPYHVVHFDGHGVFAEVATQTSARPGRRGYLQFEGSGRDLGSQLVDGPTLGRLLSDARVPVLVMNACRSAYAEAPAPPEVAASQDAAPDGGGQADAHDRIRAYGSLAAEVAYMGVPGVVAMRYNVYVVTAAQFVMDLYAHLLAGRSLGSAASEARRRLAADPMRQVADVTVPLQDWTVPVVYEAAPMRLLSPESASAPAKPGGAAETVAPRRAGLGAVGYDEAHGTATHGVPRPPTAGFHGRDGWLLVLDRMFDIRPVILLHALAGAGKSATAAEFARWYVASGGLRDPERPQRGLGRVIWSSFHQSMSLEQLLDKASTAFRSELDRSGVAWPQAAPAPIRRDLMLRILSQAPALWIWDGVEAVAGIPDSRALAEQEALAGFLDDLATKTQCKVLLTSRGDERAWLGPVPARVTLPSMPIWESQQLAHAIAVSRGHVGAQLAWRPLLRYAAGNPLTITVLVEKALREGLTCADDVSELAGRLWVGTTAPEAADDEKRGRAASLAASLGYGLAGAFTDIERRQLALLHLFRDAVDADAYVIMGTAAPTAPLVPDAVAGDAVPELAGMSRAEAAALLDRAADVGLLTPLRDGFYSLHPALPWYLTRLFTSLYAPQETVRASRAYARAHGDLCHAYAARYYDYDRASAVDILRTAESNLRHARAMARDFRDWEAASACLHGLFILCDSTGRKSEWASILAEAAGDHTDPVSGGPVAGRELYWAATTRYLAIEAVEARDWPTATRLQQECTAFYRDAASSILAEPGPELHPGGKSLVRQLVSSLASLGEILIQQHDPGCLPYYQEALSLCRRKLDSAAAAEMALPLGNSYLSIPQVRDLDQAEYWYNYSLDRLPPQDRLGRLRRFWALGLVASERFNDAHATGAARPVLLEHLNAALDYLHQALNSASPDDIETLASLHNWLGNLYQDAANLPAALDHYQWALHYQEDMGDHYRAAATRHNIAGLLEGNERTQDAVHYAQAALSTFEAMGRGAVYAADVARQRLAELRRRNSPKNRPADIADVLTAYQQAVESGNVEDITSALASLKRLLQAQGDLQAARAVYRTAVGFRYTPDPAMAAAALGVLLEDFGDTEGAQEAYEEAVDAGHPEVSPLAAARLGDLLAQTGDLTGARASYQQAIDSEDAENAPAAAIGLGNLLEELGDTDGAQTAYQQAIGAEDTKMATLAAFNYATLLHEQADMDGAREAYRQAAAIAHPDDPVMAAAAFGLLLEDLGDTESARAAYEDAVDAGHPEASPLAAARLGNLLEQAGDAPEARAFYQQAIDSGDAEYAPAAAVGLGNLLRQLGDIEDAQAAYQLAIGSGHADHGIRAMIGLGNLRWQTGDLEGARVAYQHVVNARHPEYSAPTVLALGATLKELGDVEGACAAYQQGMNSDEAQIAALSAASLAVLLVELGDMAGARAACQKAIQAGDSDFIEDMTKLLHELDDTTQKS
jgi:predicted negative regulator of RcsB-dependent stress response